MKILQLISSAGYFGAESVLIELSLALQSLGHTVVVGIFNNKHRPNLDLVDAATRVGLSVEIFECRGRLDLSAVRLIEKYVRNASIDVLHTHGYKSNTYALLSNWRNRRLLVSTCHNWINANSKMRLYGWFDRLILRNYDEVVPVSRTVHDQLVRAGFDPSVLTIVENGIDTRRYGDQTTRPASRAEYGFDDGNMVIGTVGRLSGEKGLIYLLQAVHQLPSTINWRLLIIGDGEQRNELERIAHDLEISDKVVFAGRRNDIPNVIQAMDLFALPSLVEAQPIALLEAMASGIPVAASAVGDVPIILRDGELGEVVPAGDATALSYALYRSLSNTAEAKARASTARRHVCAQYSSERMARDYLVVYRRARQAPIASRKQ